MPFYVGCLQLQNAIFEPAKKCRSDPFTILNGHVQDLTRSHLVLGSLSDSLDARTAPRLNSFLFSCVLVHRFLPERGDVHTSIRCAHAPHHPFDLPFIFIIFIIYLPLTVLVSLQQQRSSTSISTLAIFCVSCDFISAVSHCTCASMWCHATLTTRHVVAIGPTTDTRTLERTLSTTGKSSSR